MLVVQFTFPTLTPLPKQPGDPADPQEVSIINLQNVRFSYDVSKGLPFIFDTPISFNVKQGTRVGIMGPNGELASCLRLRGADMLFAAI